MMKLDSLIATRANVMFYIVALLFSLTLIWALIAEIDQVVRAEAVVEPSGKVQTIQARFQGRVSKISAEVGQSVIPGTLLFELDDSDLRAKINQNESQLKSAEAELARLVLESQGKDQWAIDASLGSEVTRQEQKALFGARNLEWKSEDELVSQQILRLEAAIKESEARADSAKRRLLFLIEERQIYEPLVKEGIEPRVRLLDIESRIEDAENTVVVEGLSINSKRIEINELEQRRIQLRLSFQSEARQRASEVRQRLEQAQAEREGLLDRLEATRLTAPVAGTLTAVYPAGAGAVVSAGEALADVVPDSDSFLIKAKVLPKDISNVFEGQLARVSFVAYDFSRFGVLEAEVIEIAQNTTETERGEVFYDTWVRTSQNVFSKSGLQPKIIPGMLAQVDILGDKQSVMDYIMSPILQTTNRALTEQ